MEDILTIGIFDLILGFVLQDIIISTKNVVTNSFDVTLFASKYKCKINDFIFPPGHCINSTCFFTKQFVKDVFLSIGKCGLFKIFLASYMKWLIVATITNRHRTGRRPRLPLYILHLSQH